MTDSNANEKDFLAAVVKTVMKVLDHPEFPDFSSKYSNRIFNDRWKAGLSVLKEFLDVPYGDLVKSLPSFYGVLEMGCAERIPHKDTLMKFSGRLPEGLLDTILGETARLLCGPDIVMALDSTGMSLNRYGGWRSYHGNMKPVTGWIKLRAAADKRCGDMTCFDGLMEHVFSAGHNVGKVLADAACDSRAIWNGYAAKGIEVAINIRNSQLKKNIPDHPGRIRSHGSMARGREMARIQRVGRDEWKREKGYGRRWKVECTFSDVKRLFGDTLRSRKQDSDVEETVAKVNLLNECKRIRMRCQKSE
ncbi:transposase [Methanomassiliicoccaceae archaeon COG_1]|nr:transposase [Methanomassiliicoccaceae archaeon COG_1]